MAEHSHEHTEKREIRIPFSQFLEHFPEVPLPTILSEETAHSFSKENEVLHSLIIDQYFMPLEGDMDEFTEIVPCFRFPETKDFHAIVYWKAGLLQYYFILVTLSLKGELIDRRVLAGTFVDGETVTQSVATIDEDWIITIVTGQAKTDRGALYDATASKTTSVEVMPDGSIIDSE
ncbi:MAG: hypothetical protein IPL49_12930 [Saprospirales bacterium]|nr:hypothetical protein [Saprospirales bacterium]MBK8491754.1 hypothetical protein [Saprospirales bacterium]